MQPSPASPDAFSSEPAALAASASPASSRASALVGAGARGAAESAGTRFPQGLERASDQREREGRRPAPSSAPSRRLPRFSGPQAPAAIGAAMAMTAAIMWGTNGVISSALFGQGITPLTLVEARSIITALGMGGLLLAVARGGFRVKRRDVPLLLLFGLSLAVVTYSYFLAVKFLPVAIAVMIQYTGPTLIALYTALTLRRLPPPRIWLALGLTLVGIALLAGLADLLGGSSARGVTLLGVVIASASAVIMAFYILVGERLGKRLHPQTSIFYGFTMAALLWLAVQPPWNFQTAALAPGTLPLVLAVGVIGTLIPFGLFLAAINRLDATRAAILATLEPVTATLLSWLWLGQSLDTWQVVGGLLVLVGVTVVQLKR